MSTVSIEGISVSYGGATVLDDVTLEVPDGSVLTLVGASGSGKTTLLRTVAGFVEPATGRIRVGERELVSTNNSRRTSVPPEKRNLAMVFQHHAVWPHMTAAGNVAYPLRRRGIPGGERRARVRAALAAVDLAELAERRPDTLSGGQRQRVALARAIVAQPDALLLDEALSALDEPLRAALRLNLRQLVDAEGLTVVQVTHDREKALALADRIAVLDRGRVAQVGSPAELLERPGTPEVAQFLQDATVLDGSIDVDGTFRTPDGALAVPGHLIGSGVPGPTRLVLLPHHLRVTDPGAGIGPPADVEATFFGRSGSSMVCRWLGRRVTVLAATSAIVGVRAGDAIGLQIERAIAYAADPVGDASVSGSRSDTESGVV